MSYLLYCVFKGSQYQGRVPVAGVEGEPVLLFGGKGLCAAISRTPPSGIEVKIPQLLSYKQVIEAVHQRCAVIPMRYGCLFEKKEEISHLLETNRSHYTKLLKDLDGCVEMGVRLLIQEKSPSVLLPEPPASAPVSSGRAYLAARKVHYVREEGLSDELCFLIDRCREALKGLYVKDKSEKKAAGHLSLYFLVPQESIKPFREAFSKIRLKDSVKILLSGPWPPYNFVTSVDSREQ